MGRKITFQGKPLTLAGRMIRENMPAPDFRVVTQDLKEVGLAEFKGKLKIINSFPSLDTPVCDLQVKEFNKKAAGISTDILIIGISKDLPFAQKRFCQAFEIKNEIVLSDYKTSSFGINYGLLIKELNLLARAALILDKNDAIRYIQVAEELTAPLNYADILKNLETLANAPALSPEQGLPSGCRPCEGGIAAMPKEKIEQLLLEHNGWELVEDKKIVKEFKFKDFIEAKYFLDLVSVIAEEQGHHPTLTVIYNKLKITLTTHAASGLTENDFIMARLIDSLSSGE